MKKYTSTTLFKLEFGDRFYYSADKKMQVYEIVGHGNEYASVKADDKLHPKVIRTNKAVVFLRNSNQ